MVKEVFQFWMGFGVFGDFFFTIYKKFIYQVVFFKSWGNPPLFTKYLPVLVNMKIWISKIPFTHHEICSHNILWPWVGRFLWSCVKFLLCMYAVDLIGFHTCPSVHWALCLVPWVWHGIKCKMSGWHQNKSSLTSPQVIHDICSIIVSNGSNSGYRSGLTYNACNSGVLAR